MSSPYAEPLPFYNRESELSALDRAWNASGEARLALLYGRRRLGKTFLLQRFFACPSGQSQRPHCYYLADQSTAASQRLQLAQQVLEALPDPGVPGPEELAVSWSSILRHLARHSLTSRTEKGDSSGRFGLILDEFPYLVQETPELPSTLQSWWDREGVHSRLFVVLCGSQLSTMATLGAPNAPLYGRFNAGIMLLEPLMYPDVARFYADTPQYGLRDKLAMFGVLGGTPRYHAMVNTGRPMDEQIVDLLLRPYSPLQNEVQFLLGSEHIRDPAPYNAVLRVIAGGATQFGEIANQSGADAKRLSYYLGTLQELGWLRRELPFGETRERRGIFRIADPFLHFWYRFVAALSSELQFSDPALVYQERIRPHLPNYMGWYAFEDICHQWLRLLAREKLGLTIRRAGRYWSRDGRIEIDVVAELADEEYLFGECKWREAKPVGTDVYAGLRAKVASLAEAAWVRAPRFILFTTSGYTPELRAIAADPQNRLALIGPADLLPEV